MPVKQQQYQRGVTLIELLVAMTVLIVSLSIMLPSFSSLISGNKLSGQTDEIRTALVYARSEAIRLNQAVVFCHSNNNMTCTVPAASGWEGWIVQTAAVAMAAPTVPALRSGLFPQAPMKVSSDASLAAAGHAVRFTPQGLARMPANNTPLSAQIRFCVAQPQTKPNIRDLQFDSGGRIQVLSSDASGVCT
ncbi:GspH/FimT family pseudopilin [Rheinheimera sp.]|uniref:GspH/FimT family pseudopilin n=1 Tax=Rheinheimera sp. TaxID=1869214 RepID=UPI0027BA37AE|nr:GspH/FimT family pseudopilin [Rheinheimera sp.]